jgi:anti-sigma factor RsiW
MADPPSDDHAVLLVHAYLDGELDAANALGAAQRLRTEPALAAEAERIGALQRLIRERLPRQAAPPGLHARIVTSVGGVQRRRAQPSWRALAASIVLTAMVASGATWFIAGSAPADKVADMLVSDHIRALMAPQPTDVASSDRHTVKPWFNGRIPESPRVVDLAKAGFPLVGGRLDVVGRTPVPTLVYRHDKHLISLTEIPAASHLGSAAAPRSVDGYNFVHWTDNGVSYWAISDLAAAGLEDFAKLFRATPPES